LESLIVVEAVFLRLPWRAGIAAKRVSLRLRQDKRDNISGREFADLKKLAAQHLRDTNAEIAKALSEKELKGLPCDRHR